MKVILVSSYEVIVDDDFVRPRSFCLEVKDGNRVSLRHQETGARVYLGRYIMGLTKADGPMKPDTLVVDHINRNGLDNRRENLRVCKQSDNMLNRIAPKGKWRGVYWDKTLKRWRGRVTYRGKSYGTPCRTDKETTRQEILELRRKLYGEFFHDAQ